VFVKQFRPPVFLTRICENLGIRKPLEPGDIDLGSESQGQLGVTLELCAGIVDKASLLKMRRDIPLISVKFFNFFKFVPVLFCMDSKIQNPKLFRLEMPSVRESGIVIWVP
jgi:hypothetical protein